MWHFFNCIKITNNKKAIFYSSFLYGSKATHTFDQHKHHKKMTKEDSSNKHVYLDRQLIDEERDVQRQFEF